MRRHLLLVAAASLLGSLSVYAIGLPGPQGASSGGGGSGTASPYGAWTALDGIAPAGSTTFATLDARNGHRVLDCDDSTQESVIFEGSMHADYADGTITLTLTWAATSATTGDVTWAAQWERIDAGTLDIDADSFATAQTATDTTDGTSGATVATTITFTAAQADGISAGEPFRLLIYRDATDSGDDMTGDAELLRVTYEE